MERTAAELRTRGRRSARYGGRGERGELVVVLLRIARVDEQTAPPQVLLHSRDGMREHVADFGGR